MKKIAGVVIFFLLLTSFVSSIDQTQARASETITMGNKFCPVSGDKVSGKHFVMYKGKRYELCCPMCEKDFKKNPAKYIAKMTKQEVAQDHQEHSH